MTCRSAVVKIVLIGNLRWPSSCLYLSYFPATVLFTCIKSWFFRNHLANFPQILHWSYCCDDRIGKMLHNICISAVVMSFMWASRGPWASCFFNFLFDAIQLRTRSLGSPDMVICLLQIYMFILVCEWVSYRMYLLFGAIHFMRRFTKPYTSIKSATFLRLCDYFYPRAFRRKSGDIVIPTSVRPSVMSHHCS